MNDFMYKGHRLMNMDSFKAMDKLISEGIKVDAIITDPPFGTTACSWDSVLPFTYHIIDDKGKVLYLQDILFEGYSIEFFNENKKEGMWERLNKLIKPNGAIVLFGSEPFSSALRMSNIKNYKYDWIWEKTRPSNPLLAKKHPLKYHETISLFSNKSHNYYPIKVKGVKNHSSGKQGGSHFNQITQSLSIYPNNTSRWKYPKSIQKFNRDLNTVHPTQKPLALMEYLIKTYTNENEIVLDFTIGSGTTIKACDNTKRFGIGIDNGVCNANKTLNGIEIKDLPWVEVTKLRLDSNEKVKETKEIETNIEDFFEGDK